MPAQHGFTDSYWMGYLANTVAAASVQRDPQPVLKSALREFMAGNHDHPVVDMLRTTLIKEKR